MEKYIRRTNKNCPFFLNEQQKKRIVAEIWAFVQTLGPSDRMNPVRKRIIKKKRRECVATLDDGKPWVMYDAKTVSHAQLGPANDQI